MCQKHTLLTIILLCILCLLTWNAFAKNLGVIGQTYPITEFDLRHIIQQRLLTLQQNGELNKLTIKLNQALQQQMDKPQPISKLKRTTQSRTWLFNPSIRIPYDLKNANGDVIIPAGTTINPLNTLSLSETLLIYNADDPEQVRWAQRQNMLLKNNDKLILTGGSITSQMKLFKKAVFFDQNGRLTARFQIKQVPAIVTQQGKRLKIQEVLP